MALLADESFEISIDRIKWEKLEEELKCCSCGDLFEEPKTLTCSHTFCKKCVNDNLTDCQRSYTSSYTYVFTEGFTIKPSKKFICTVCKASFSEKELEKVPKNISMECLVNIVKKRRAYVKATMINEKDEDASDLTVTCTQCEESAPASWWCMTCEDAEICEECYKSHCRLKIFKSHKVVELEEFIRSPSFILNCQPYCVEHRTQPLQRYCKSCHQFMCQQCTNLDFCNRQLCKAHDFEVVNDVYETKVQKIKKVDVSLQVAQQKVTKKLESVEHTNKELNQTATEETAWVQETFHMIRKLVDKCEKDLLLNIETIQTTGKNLLHKQTEGLSQREKQLDHYKRFISGILFPFRLQEIFVYGDQISTKCLEEVGDDVDDDDDDGDDDYHDANDQVDDHDEPVYKTEDMVISRGSLDLDDLTQKLLSLHQIFHPPHIPSCSVQLLSDHLTLVKVKVTLKDKYGPSVGNQMSYLDIQSGKSKSFFTKLNWKYEGDGVHLLSYCPLVRELHSVSVTWKDVVLGGADLLVYDHMELQRTTGFCRYNKRSLVRPLFLAKASEYCVIVSDPGDARLIVMSEGFYYNCVITNSNYPNFSPTGAVAGLNNCCLYVANSGEDCIYRYNKWSSVFGYQYNNHSSSCFGGTGTKDGQFQSPQGLAMSKCGRLYICDRNNHRIQVYDTADNQEHFCYTYGEEEHLFNHPTDVALNKEEDKLFVTDTDNHKVQVFTLSSPFATMCHAYFIDFKDMRNPFGVRCTDDGLVWVTSTDHVFVFKEDGTFNGGCKCDDKGPAGITTTSNGEIVIAFTKSKEVVCYTRKA